MSFDILSFPFIVIVTLSMTHEKDVKAGKMFDGLLSVKPH
jgi:hypothetical protein